MDTQVPLSESIRRASKLLEELLESSEVMWTSHEDNTWAYWCASTWDQLFLTLHRASSMHQPANHDGLAALWLRVVTRMAQQVEKEANSNPKGFEGLDGKSKSLDWLRQNAEYLARKTQQAEDRVTQRFAELSQATPRNPFSELKELAEKAKTLCDEFNRPRRPSSQKRSDFMQHITSITEQAGLEILTFLNGGSVTSDPILDEIVLYAIGLDYKQVHANYVFGAMANLWLPKKWKGFPDDYWKNSGGLREEFPVSIASDELADWIVEITSKLSSLAMVTTGSLPYQVDLDVPQVVCDGTAFPVTYEVARMLQLLLESDSWISMRANDISRPDRLMAQNKIPKPIQKMLESAGKLGYRIRPEFRRNMAK